MPRKYVRKSATREEQTELTKAAWTQEKRMAHSIRLKAIGAAALAQFVAKPIKICKKCHVEKALVAFSRAIKCRDGHMNVCKACRNIRRVEIEAADPCKAARYKAMRGDKEKLKERYQKNREKYLKYWRDRLLANPNFGKEKYRREALRNPGRTRERGSQHRRDQQRATPQWLSSIQKAQNAELYELATAKQVQTGVKQHVDHIVPLKGKYECGLHVPWNLQILTGVANCSKHNRILAP